ncbi:hypothetical protein SDC9_53204 [bioreactor metagenome]|uniref:DUF5050 domain-containing protein n=1 Tax=bioreactor metagenome TaxID=1076179 RepID=A0A644WTM9_9ZZZZ|nr:hypothetical protein [Oscillospiraceae bacterium]
MIRIRKSDLKTENLGKCDDQLALVSKDKLFFCTNTNKVYYTDLEMNNGVEIIKEGRETVCDLKLYGDDELFYIVVPQSGENLIFNGRKLYKINIKTKENMLLTENLSEYYLTNNYVYYQPYSNEETGAFRIDEQTGEKTPIIIHLSGEIFRCDHNGENKELVFKSNTVYFSQMIVENNYIFGGTIIFDRENTKLLDIHKLICLDIHNKEWWYIENK